MQGSKWIFTCCMLILTVLSFPDSPAQKKENKNKLNSISICIRDSISDSPLEFANFVLMKAEDSSLVTGAVSDAGGMVHANNIPMGDYTGKISFTGYTDIFLNIRLAESMKYSDTVYLSGKNIQMDEVIVAAEKEKIIYEKDKVVYNVGNDINSIGGSAIDILENAPLVKVDIDENISLAGNSEVEILIDGIAINSMGISTKEYLRSLRWFEIDRIEIMQNPPAEYNLTNNGGAINIITKKINRENFTASIDGKGTTKNEYSGGLGFNYGMGKHSLRATVSGNYKHQDYLISDERITSKNEKTIILNQDKNVDYDRLSSGYRLMFSHLFGKKLSINHGIGYNYLENKNNNKSNSVYSNNLDEVTEKKINNQSSSTNTGFLSYNLNYIQRFNNPGQGLRVGFGYSNNLMNLKTNLNNTDITPNMPVIVEQQNYSLNKNISYRFNSSYNQPVFSGFDFSVSYTYNQKNLNLQNNYYTLEEENFIEDTGDKTFQKYTERTHSMIMEFSGRIDELEIDLPISMRKQLVNSFDDITREDFRYNFTSFLPGLSLFWKIKKNLFVSAKWGKQEFFPMNKQLNPHIDYSDSANITMGNPNLVPQKSTRYSCDFTWLLDESSINGGVSYSHTADIIESYSYMQNELTSITTFRNIGKNKRLSAFVIGSTDLLEWWNADLWLSMNQSEYYHGFYNSKSFHWFTNLNTSIKFTNFSLGIDFNYSSPQYTFQSKTKEYFDIDITSKMKLFSKKLTLSLRVNDLLNTYAKKSNVTGIGFVSLSNSNETTRVISLSLSYFFQAKENPQEIREEMIDDDF